MSNIKKTPQPTTYKTLQILYEDNHIIVVNKRNSDIVQGDKTGDPALVDVVKQYIKLKYDKPGDVFLGVAHRLDRPVSGVVLFAKTSKALVRINEMIRDRQIKKTYWAVVSGRPPMVEDTLVMYMKKNEEKNKSYIVPEGSKGGLKAELTYKVVGGSEKYTFLEVGLISGRHHQIRVQLAAIGCIIKGDLKYGSSRSNEDGAIHLHARNVQFIHPVKKEPITVTAPPPKDVLWDIFLQSQ